jgi:hypothetical protein
MTAYRQQTRHQDLTIIRANEHFHDCSGGHFKIFPLYKVNTEGDFLRRINLEHSKFLFSITYLFICWFTLKLLKFNLHASENHFFQSN